MTIRLDNFVIEITNGKQFTPRQVYEYITNEKQVKAYGLHERKSRRIIRRSKSRLEKTVKKGKVDMDQSLTIESEIGSKIAELARQYNEKMIPLIEEVLRKSIGPAYF